MKKLGISEFELSSFLPFELYQASEVLSQSFAKIYRDRYDITRDEWRVFAHLGQGDILNFTEISEASKLNKTTVSRAVFKLEKRNWISRSFDSRDRRIQYLSLTDLGTKVYKELSDAALIFNQHLIDRLGEGDYRTAVSALQKLQNLD
ncbi:MarR family winged helix-turn-helix transcriptional regulator [Lentilitoribacter sp. Alg239-R112]|jgi:DNA-binding MarR family transcriptional regulator|uniref:MarR family winged helix-turn-helix transcriptional regulator n=1 Tax=Lentilitoribacter sp. Alg239-R112 TaxID=2305987 RepID=UPI0013A6D3B8|nr:MarR family winged helix-turn-helix transcriptional regulator [Lentilitoribacter sp. Alg239-R112]